MCHSYEMRRSHLVVKSLTHGSWSGNIVNRKPPPGGGFLSIKFIRVIHSRDEMCHSSMNYTYDLTCMSESSHTASIHEIKCVIHTCPMRIHMMRTLHRWTTHWISWMDASYEWHIWFDMYEWIIIWGIHSRDHVCHAPDQMWWMTHLIYEWHMNMTCMSYEYSYVIWVWIWHVCHMTCMSMTCMSYDTYDIHVIYIHVIWVIWILIWHTCHTCHMSIHMSIHMCRSSMNSLMNDTYGLMCMNECRSSMNSLMNDTYGLMCMNECRSSMNSSMNDTYGLMCMNECRSSMNSSRNDTYGLMCMNDSWSRHEWVLSCMNVSWVVTTWMNLYMYTYPR